MYQNRGQWDQYPPAGPMMQGPPSRRFDGYQDMPPEYMGAPGGPGQQNLLQDYLRSLEFASVPSARHTDMQSGQFPAASPYSIGPGYGPPAGPMPHMGSGPMGPMPPHMRSGPMGMGPGMSGPLPPHMQSGPMGGMPPGMSGPIPPHMQSGPMPMGMSGPLGPYGQSGPMNKGGPGGGGGGKMGPPAAIKKSKDQELENVTKANAGWNGLYTAPDLLKINFKGKDKEGSENSEDDDDGLDPKKAVKMKSVANRKIRQSAPWEDPELYARTGMGMGGMGMGMNRGYAPYSGPVGGPQNQWSGFGNRFSSVDPYASFTPYGTPYRSYDPYMSGMFPQRARYMEDYMDPWGGPMASMRSAPYPGMAPEPWEGASGMGPSMGPGMGPGMGGMSNPRAQMMDAMRRIQEQQDNLYRTMQQRRYGSFSGPVDRGYGSFSGPVGRNPYQGYEEERFPPSRMTRPFPSYEDPEPYARRTDFGGMGPSPYSGGRPGYSMSGPIPMGGGPMGRTESRATAFGGAGGGPMGRPETRFTDKGYGPPRYGEYSSMTQPLYPTQTAAPNYAPYSGPQPGTVPAYGGAYSSVTQPLPRHSMDQFRNHSGPLKPATAARPPKQNGPDIIKANGGLGSFGTAADLLKIKFDDGQDEMSDGGSPRAGLGPNGRKKQPGPDGGVTRSAFSGPLEIPPDPELLERDVGATGDVKLSHALRKQEHLDAPNKTKANAGWNNFYTAKDLLKLSFNEDGNNPPPYKDEPKYGANSALRPAIGSERNKGKIVSKAWNSAMRGKVPTGQAGAVPLVPRGSTRIAASPLYATQHYGSPMHAGGPYGGGFNNSPGPQGQYSPQGPYMDGMGMGYMPPQHQPYQNYSGPLQTQMRGMESTPVAPPQTPPMSPKRSTENQTLGEKLLEEGAPNSMPNSELEEALKKVEDHQHALLDMMADQVADEFMKATTGGQEAAASDGFGTKVSTRSAQPHNIQALESDLERELAKLDTVDSFDMSASEVASAAGMRGGA